MNSLDKRGFTLIEVVIALAILAIGILAMFSMQTMGIKGNTTANHISTGSTWAADRLELLMALPYDDDDLNDTDLDGTDQDVVDKNGLDDNGGNFGLEDATPATADHSATSPDNIYTIYWNVAVDVPFTNTKTVHVIVQQLNRADIEFEYIKDRVL